MRSRALITAAALLLASACARPAQRFSLENARAHVQMLAGTIGCRPVGTPENARAREYIVDQLTLFGFDVRVQETDARRPEHGNTAHVVNIIAVRQGSERGAIGLLSHYDSSPDAPGAADDGLGVAVSLEAARVLAARNDRRHTLLVLITDGEEAGLMGAAGLVEDRDVMDRLQAYVNIEAIGSAGTALLFETGPENGWIVKPWARSAPHPRGGSYGIEVYKRLPNDTDFSILKRYGVPGLNFAPVGDSYAYHTARDTADRLTDETLRNTGENLVSTILALDTLDLTKRSTSTATYFDIGGVVALSWGPVLSWLIAAAALVCALLAWFKVLGASIRLIGLGRWILDAVWAVFGTAVVSAAMIGTAWALRAARTVYHPWYAHPDRFFVLLLFVGIVAGWAIARAGALLPTRAHAPRHPVLVWSMALPLWVIVAGVLAAKAPVAGYLWTLPLLAAGAGLLAVPATSASAVRAVSVAVLAVAGTLWLRETTELLRFTIAVLGRMPFITPVWVYPALMLTGGLMVVPPFVSAVVATKPLLRPSFVTALLFIVVAIAAGLSYSAPAYTHAQPQRRDARVIVDPGASVATYEVASQEPGLDLEESAPRGWYRVTDAPQAATPFPAFHMPFVFRTKAPSPGPPPAVVSAFTLTPSPQGTDLSMTIVPQTPGLTAAFLLPDDVKPVRSNLPGIMAGHNWRAAYIAIPSEGVTWRATFAHGVESRLPAAQALIVSSRFPGGSGWQSLPAWLPQEHAVWSLRVIWILGTPTAIPPVPPLK
jgi:peptidase M28-like protein